jgi:hypothetical protein
MLLANLQSSVPEASTTSVSIHTHDHYRSPLLLAKILLTSPIRFIKTSLRSIEGGVPLRLDHSRSKNTDACSLLTSKRLFEASLYQPTRPEFLLASRDSQHPRVNWCFRLTDTDENEVSTHPVTWALLPDSPLSNPCLNGENHKPSLFPHAFPFLIFLPTHLFALCPPAPDLAKTLVGSMISDCRSSRSQSRQRLDGFNLNHQSSIINPQSPIFNLQSSPDSPLSNPCLNGANHKPSPFPHAFPFLIFLPTHLFALYSPRPLSRQEIGSI